MSIIEGLEGLVVGGYTVRLNYIDDGKEGISIIEDSVDTKDNELIREGTTLKSEVQFYIVCKEGKLYNKALLDMLTIQDNLYSGINKIVGSKYIMDVECQSILNLGVSNGFNNVSMNVLITYKMINK